ncbi:MAG: isoprenylcysteine carboxylmethyltransferase family protein [Anaerolineae bacterium]|nr:isoprenylcysteine carboxylmethyltransferase family protein [Anaerolineae bacterium]
MNALAEYRPALLNVAAAAAVFAISLLIDLSFPLSAQLAKPVGFVVVYAGMALVLWAAYHLRGAFLGEVEPVLDSLVQDGPYRLVRHPVYLGMTVAFAGATIAMRSWLGLLAVFLLFLPSEVYRARLEEAALRSKFGDEWERYAAQTGFMLPSVGRAIFSS